MSESFGDLEQKIDQVQKGLNGSALRDITGRVGGKAKVALPPKIQPGGLSNWGRGAKRGGYTIKARYDLKSDHEVMVTPSPLPLVGLLEKGSYKAGSTWKAPKRRGSARRKKGTISTYNHAHVPAREAWSKGVRGIEPQVPRWIHDEVVKLIGQVF
jgi:hypothetical protein